MLVADFDSADDAGRNPVGVAVLGPASVISGSGSGGHNVTAAGNLPDPDVSSDGRNACCEEFLTREGSLRLSP